MILAFIGVKLVFHACTSTTWRDWAPFGGEIPIWLSLCVIIGTLTITTVASLVKSQLRRGHAPRPARTNTEHARRRLG